jgi:hypothetical protein
MVTADTAATRIALVAPYTGERVITALHTGIAIAAYRQGWGHDQEEKSAH